MKIKEFCKQYEQLSTKTAKEKFIKDNIQFKTYVSFLMKDTLAQNLINVSMYEYEDYIDEDGNKQRRKTGNIQVNSTVQYLLFCRLIIENYTDLEIENKGFYEDYDALNQSGVMDIIMQSIPEKEIGEFKAIIDMKQKDAFTNSATPHAFIQQQVQRFGMLTGITLKPILDKIASELETLDENKIEKLGKMINKGLKRVK